ncbi:helix-turn-helix transcriptional regulator [Embleya sp. NPDC005971]|uniref:helix-turn-helix domain-containing protein n=1 Tax=Embleya sp. NPDC005971 TaxID=3156724 RepID=UPI0033D47EA8
MTPNGAKIREQRNAQKLTLRALADATGLDHGYLSRLERGKRGATPDALARIAGVLEIPVDAILTRRPIARRHPSRSGGPTRYSLRPRRLAGSPDRARD